MTRANDLVAGPDAAFSIRELFAAKIMAGLMSTANYDHDESHVRQAAVNAVKSADALIDALNGIGGQS